MHARGGAASTATSGKASSRVPPPLSPAIVPGVNPQPAIASKNNARATPQANVNSSAVAVGFSVMVRWRSWVLLFVVSAVACSTSAPSQPAVAPAPATPQTTPPPAAPVPPATRVPPAVETSCAVDADCVVTTDELVDAAPRTHACCPGCTTHAVTLSWRTRFRAWCESNPAPMCPPIGCAMQQMRAVCVAGQCTAKPVR